MLIGIYHFSCVFETEAVLPFYKGSTFRGVFGRALKKVVCALRLRDCPDCMLNDQCLYARMFESPTVPRPFVIEPPLDSGSRFPPGSSFDFSLLLFGETNKKLPYFIYAFREMGHVGIGKRINGQRGRFTLERVCHEGRVVYDIRQEKIVTPNVPDVTIPRLQRQEPTNLRARVALITPLRIKYKNRLSPDLPFHVLVRAVLRRLSTLFEAYGEGEPDLDYTTLVRDAEKIKTVDNDISWFDWRRYSFRQDKQMLMGGLVGSIVYEGKLGPYLPLLELSSMVHLGKQTTFGLGKIHVEVLQ